MAELTKSFIDLTDPNMTMPEDKDLFSLFKRVQKAGRVTEFVNLQTDERVDSNYILQQVSDIDSDLVNINAQHFLWIIKQHVAGTARRAAIILYVDDILVLTKCIGNQLNQNSDALYNKFM